MKTFYPGTSAEFDVEIIGQAESWASISSGTVYTSVYEYGETLGADAKADAEWRDLIMILNPTAGATDLNYIPVEFCSDMASGYSNIGTNKSRLTYGDYHWQGSAAGDALIWDSGSSGNVSHTSNNKICNTGDIKMQGTAVYFVITLSTTTIGNSGTDVVQDGNGTNVNIKVRDGVMNADFSMGALPAGATCYSASGVFSGV